MRLEPWALVLVAVAGHLLIVWAVWQRADAPRTIKAPQEIELLRATPEVKPVAPPPHRPEPPKAAAQPKQAPPPVALRTAPATTALAPADTVRIAENLQAQKSSGPIVAAPPSSPLATKADEPVTEANAFAGYLNNPPPVYPKSAQRQGLQGRVLLRVHVLANGQVGNAEIKQSSGKPVLDEAALAAVRGWTFAPAKKGLTAIDGWATVPIDFKLAS